MASTALGANNTDKLRFFETKVRPLLAAECFECHSADKAEGGLRLDTAATIRAGGDSGPVLVPGKPEQSLLVNAIRYEDLEMPPKGPLTKTQQETLIKWIRDGAVWPEESPPTRSGKEEAEKSWWAGQPLSPGTVPNAIKDSRSRHPIDRYVDRALNKVGLKRSETADRRLLIRRLSLDLLGLPPTPEQIKEFVEDAHPMPTADSLIACSPHRLTAREWRVDGSTLFASRSLTDGVLTNSDHKHGVIDNS
jgi:hypothetical protein